MIEGVEGRVGILIPSRCDELSVAGALSTARCYGLPGFIQIMDYLIEKGWPRQAFWLHGGHLFCLHLVAALGLSGAEVNPFGFQPLCGLYNGAQVVAGFADLPPAPGIGFELRGQAHQAFRSLLGDDRW
ncbi:MAG: hypothetical protein JO227_17245 [Acetobacteraceae bacterium]|nr:hypothetical protein [Acetobacteraceae bacterium]